MTFTGKVVIVTGGSSGIGESVCRKFAAAGAKVAVVASSNRAKAVKVAEEIAGAGGSAKAFTVDVQSYDDARHLLADVRDALGNVDILVNSAGLYLQTPVGDEASDESSIANMNAMVDINLKGSFNMIAAVTPLMKAHGGGKIVNVSSVCAFLGIGGFSIYCATKAAIAMMTRALAIELAPFDINVNAIAPGNTKTPMNEEYRNDPKNAVYLQSMEEKTPSNVTFSSPDEMADMIMFLASDAARPMHGSTLLADEGLAAGM